MSDLEDTLLEQIRIAGLPEPEREYRFARAQKRRYRADFAYPERQLLVEVEGGIWSGGRHTRGDGYTRDIEKYNLAALLGYRVVRVTGDMIEDGSALNWLCHFLLEEAS